MQNDFKNFHRESLEQVTAIAGEEFTYNGCVYTGLINMQELSSELTEGGLLEVYTTHLIVSKVILSVAPVAGQTLYIGTQKARIVRVGSDEVSYELACVAAVK